MFGKKKKEEYTGLPDLPPSGPPSMADYNRRMSSNQLSEESNKLPSFPDSPMGQGFSQSMIKDSVSESSDLPSLPGNETMQEITEEIPSMKSPRTVEMEEWRPQESSVPTPPTEMNPGKEFNEKKPIFVKLDKYKEAKDSLDIVKQKLSDMDELLRMIKEVKTKEDHEINSWESEIEKVKSRISFINSEIFENAYQ